MRFADQRALLVQDLARSGITDERVLAAFAKVPREVYVLPQYRDYAYRNQPLPIDLGQTISQPLMIAIMLEHLELKDTDTVLEIGTGSGYQSALLAELAQTVCTIERLEPLSLRAQGLLKEQAYKNIHFRIGDGAQGWQKAYPPFKEFNKIIVSAAATDIPAGVRKQLAVDGIMVVPVGSGYYQILNKVTRTAEGFSTSQHGGCTFVPLIST
ncbi:MAG: protein-L-isoaspartate(D-aspartate) O-methyltransferase [Candidatus Cloacimonetes bacterium]|nr:protein-L-isoaspartate(D-aspartate) O-methyltransferase [Candidatus Cloacimonadota bacterium]MDD4224552.1 protein-L-isoaspartate(D-aspartate) O-methyltransferase [Candidatus Cloacimonadota bacterium]